MKVVLASGNNKKLLEMQQILAPLGFELVPQSALQISEAPETGLTFVENALIKARHAAQVSGLAAIADDSGLEVDALQGAPGIYSARFSGANATDGDNNQRLLKALQDVPGDKRTARYQCLIVFLRHAADPTPIITQGTWEGRILTTPRGDGGFGYDPLFLLPGSGKTAAELTPEEKHRRSHRGKALSALAEKLQRNHPHLVLPASQDRQ